MSNNTNDELLERAGDLLEEITGHPSKLDVALTRAVEKNDLDEIYHLVTYIEGELSREHYHNYDLVVW